MSESEEDASFASADEGEGGKHKATGVVLKTLAN